VGDRRAVVIAHQDIARWLEALHERAIARGSKPVGIRVPVPDRVWIDRRVGVIAIGVVGHESGQDRAGLGCGPGAKAIRVGVDVVVRRVHRLGGAVVAVAVVVHAEVRAVLHGAGED
ncbi:MAG: hypothetical protein ACK56F_06830, partial [bacterium]